MLTHLRQLARNERGASMVEFSIIAFLFFLLLGGLIDFSYAFYQWNSATKALQQGARLAATSDPVDSGLRTMDGLSDGIDSGDPFPPFKSICDGASNTCTGSGVPNSSYSTTAMQTIVYGRGQTSCGTLGADQTPAMCDIFSRVQPQNVVITYEQTGLGFAGRPGGPVPTITLELQNLPFNFIFLEGIMKAFSPSFGPITIPPMRTTETGEDMCSIAPNEKTPDAPCTP